MPIGQVSEIDLKKKKKNGGQVIAYTSINKNQTFPHQIRLSYRNTNPIHHHEPIEKQQAEKK